MRERGGSIPIMPLLNRVDAAGEPLRLMAVHAHPDDESSKGAATMAKYVAEGAQVLVVTCTGGERGDVLNPRMDRPEVWADLPAIRAREMDAARTILGAGVDVGKAGETRALHNAQSGGQ